MARKPNYRFERFERERTRAAKKAARAQAKADRKRELAGTAEAELSNEAPSAPDEDDQTSD